MSITVDYLVQANEETLHAACYYYITYMPKRLSGLNITKYLNIDHMTSINASTCVTFSCSLRVVNILKYQNHIRTTYDGE